ncbi:MAG TPA: sensor domain-containing diguanylate cyclase [Candidatus Sumerlaeota bacterium]|nr:sensor domain-containing diguanylate cyclase [Candidatus Sumerlaeota bacterium]HPS02101.1 sensor domain-containing diguanylate cyclase [Candidatus Sumerlaeota bacterium]
MSHQSLSDRHKLLTLLSLLLSLGFLATTLSSYYVSKTSIRNSIENYELPLTSDTIYSEIQKDLILPVFISSMMANDTFLRDWILSGEEDVEKITKYLRQIQDRYHTVSSFLVSDRTSAYYQRDGILKRVRPDEPRDVWYYRVRDMEAPYEINVDVDLANRDALTVFINYRMFDYDGRFIGSTGVGLQVDAVRRQINDYQQRYRRDIYFVNKEGVVVLHGNEDNANGSDIHAAQGLDGLADEILAQPDGHYEYHRDGQHHLLNVRFIPELNWYLFVEKTEDEALVGIRNTLYLNLGLCFLITSVVLLITHLTVGHYQKRLEAMATTDKLTGLVNRHAFDILARQLLNDSHRNSLSVSVLVLDIDHFKTVNDRFTHITGDRVIHDVAATLRARVRKSDVVCRWGGEEFLILLKSCNLEQAVLMAEQIRLSVANQTFEHAGAPFSVTISLGVAEYLPDESEEAFLLRADRALYRAKDLGRNRVCSDELVPPAGT